MQPHDTISFLGLPEFKVIPMIETDDCFYIRIEKNSAVETCPSCKCQGDGSYDTHDSHLECVSGNRPLDIRKRNALKDRKRQNDR
jgi:hypothetical protein